MKTVEDELAIRVDNLGKCYRTYPRPMDRVFQGFIGSSRKLYKEHWALQGLDLQISRGETVGIVGRNGSGKSTLLKLIAGTLKCTTGSIEVRGKVSAMLELGSGFHPEFTGRENVYLNASVLGLDSQQIDDRFDKIVEFAELEAFIDQPVQTYSSGMYMRLAFAVASSIDPDILIIDEALSVGDAAFQRKCYGRIERLKSNGATILFVSHSSASIVELCDRAVLLEDGRRLLTGKPKPVVSLYQKLIYSGPAHHASVLDQIKCVESGEVLVDPEKASAQDSRNDADKFAEHYEEGMKSASTVEYPRRGACIVAPSIVDANGRQVNVLVSGREYIYTYGVEFEADCSGVRFGMMIKSIAGIELFGMASLRHGESPLPVRAGTRRQIEFRFVARLQPGVYFLNAGCSSMDGDEGFLHRLVDAVMFRVQPSSTRFMTGHVDLALEPACRVSAAVNLEEKAA